MTIVIQQKILAYSKQRHTINVPNNEIKWENIKMKRFFLKIIVDLNMPVAAIPRKR